MSWFSLFACSVCFGQSGLLASKSLDASVLMLVGVLAMVLFSIAYTAFTWSRNIKTLNLARGNKSSNRHA